ncbi:exonuclease domain-containing protein [Singulisphaera sp. PoT]|uniref:exonuclease domain-containing protein n=1 Tax=Singulisphaera sp. PoT TaxID=3411797 RepID=UPI003BF58EA5
MPLEFVALDLETTGLMAETDRVVEIGAIRFDAEGVELARYETYVNPGRPMSPAAQAIHGISDEDLADAPSFREIFPGLVEFLGPAESTVLLAHNASFDAGFLGREFSRIDIPPPRHSVVDTLTVARRLIPDACDHRLETLARLLGLDEGPTHRALADSQRVKGLWMRLGGSAIPKEFQIAYPIVDRQGAAPLPSGWERLLNAISRGARVRMRYDGGSRGEEPREITPRQIVNRGGTAYLVAFCHLDAFEKSFRLDRVRQYDVLGLLEDNIAAARVLEPS